MTTTIGYPGKKLVEEARKEQVRKPPEYQHSKRISCKEQITVKLR
jgi:hypothetical protein